MLSDNKEITLTDKCIDGLWMEMFLNEWESSLKIKCQINNKCISTNIKIHW